MLNNYNINFNHTIVNVTNVKKSTKFYQTLLGLKLIEEAPGYARLTSPNKTFTIGIHELEKGMKLPFNEGIRIYYEVGDLDNYCRKLSEKGINFTQPPKDMPWGWRHAYINDPDNHEISLYFAGNKRFERSQGFE